MSSRTFHTRSPNAADILATQELQAEHDRREERDRHNQRLLDEHALTVQIDALSKEIAELIQEKAEHEA